MIGRLFTITQTANKVITRHKLLSESDAARILGNAVVEKAITYGTGMAGVTINVQPVQIERSETL
jgi:hypothetical protein